MGTAALLIVLTIFWFIPIFVAHKWGRGKNSWLWGLCLGWIGVAIVGAGELKGTVNELRPAVTGVVESHSAPKKTCPECADSVQAAANVCKHCGHRFEIGASAGQPEPVS